MKRVKKTPEQEFYDIVKPYLYKQLPQQVYDYELDCGGDRPNHIYDSCGIAKNQADRQGGLSLLGRNIRGVF